MAMKFNVMTVAVLAALEQARPLVENAIVNGQTWVFPMDDDVEMPDEMSTDFIMKFDRSDVSGYWLKLYCGYRDRGEDKDYDSFYIHASIGPKALITVFDQLVNPDGQPCVHMQLEDFGSIITALAHYEQYPEKLAEMLAREKVVEEQRLEYERRRSKLSVISSPSKDQ